ncbi:hypothetical protein [Klebsiella pneumoniae]|uniref:hypothetical protein n=1 Tax=Klebsiella pneumoniae TaxID=573 RepID=UPI003D48FC69
MIVSASMSVLSLSRSTSGGGRLIYGADQSAGPTAIMKINIAAAAPSSRRAVPSGTGLTVLLALIVGSLPGARLMPELELNVLSGSLMSADGVKK